MTVAQLTDALADCHPQAEIKALHLGFDGLCFSLDAIEPSDRFVFLVNYNATAPPTPEQTEAFLSYLQSFEHQHDPNLPCPP